MTKNLKKKKKLETNFLLVLNGSNDCLKWYITWIEQGLINGLIDSIDWFGQFKFKNIALQRFYNPHWCEPSYFIFLS